MSEKVWTHINKIEARLAAVEADIAKRRPVLKAEPEPAIESIAQAKPKKPATKSTKKVSTGE